MDSIPADQLATVAVGVQLLTGAANAYRALGRSGRPRALSLSSQRRASVPAIGTWNASGALLSGVARRQEGRRRLSVTTPRAPSRWLLRAGRAMAGANRIDLLFDGSQAPDAADLNLAKRFGFVREFGSADSNHFEHDGKTADPSAGRARVLHGALRRHPHRHRRGPPAPPSTSSRTLNPQIANPNLIHPAEQGPCSMTPEEKVQAIRALPQRWDEANADSFEARSAGAPLLTRRIWTPPATSSPSPLWARVPVRRARCRPAPRHSGRLSVAPRSVPRRHPDGRPGRGRCVG
jgi:hypothetical protein